ncbi:MAG: FAD-dependent oxidoreductase [Candidatus Dormibacteraeota bacterium]|nr:FAD-dependent oxidoreductase [Candidatus Dormibacteraeota bacterium]
MAEALSLESLDRAVHGAVLRPGEDGYERARRVFNAMIDRRPSAIVRCAEAADVVAAVNCARVNGLPLSVKGGGHSVAGTAVCDGGVMVDLSPMKGVRVDPDRRVALAEPGLTLGEFDSATQSFGLATTTGVVSMTGIAGLTLGGGIGWLNGRYGLACDNLIAADVVTADGRLLTASETEHEELFWALRGGGGNFGVVTSFIYRVHPVAAVLGGGVTYPPLQARDALRFYHEFASNSPDELSTAASVTMEPFLERAAYANNLGQEGTDRVRAAYGPNYDRLARVKAEYDPANLFRLNHNVTPAERRNGL